MSKQSVEPNGQTTQRKVGNASAYSARIQEGMRRDKLSSMDYHLVMTILNAVSKGDTEEEWKAEQQRALKPLMQQDSTDGPSGYDQMVLRLKGLMLWPWE